ncbi:hypothetical protein [Flavihumibacter sp.]|uniref:hypothetical protein n=1 Tax=Flavihumibacter sp. TaxID=1913981 RepID=UPI002FC752C7
MKIIYSRYFGYIILLVIVQLCSTYKLTGQILQEKKQFKNAKPPLSKAAITSKLSFNALDSTKIGRVPVLTVGKEAQVFFANIQTSAGIAGNSNKLIINPCISKSVKPDGTSIRSYTNRIDKLNCDIDNERSFFELLGSGNSNLRSYVGVISKLRGGKDYLITINVRCGPLTPYKLSIDDGEKQQVIGFNGEGNQSLRTVISLTAGTAAFRDVRIVLYVDEGSIYYFTSASIEEINL